MHSNNVRGCVLAFFFEVVIKCYMVVCVCACVYVSLCEDVSCASCLHHPISSQKASRDQEISLFRHISGFFFSPLFFLPVRLESKLVFIPSVISLTEAGSK